ncbi:hypothetical protein N825_18805 [Skermanella stibiiresistens SB22]|uniref:Uncharacterized protein n=1 Tax=Skermanella stibiiresistens SB22 TaxID=1385369 RepID=W9HEI7_9PROT|nr:hypothetical protein [Skermanella stibiiresistens]EWY42318.1 hypothetical protein N825_18805 [Skermanella stibiiresistens SB22]
MDIEKFGNALHRAFRHLQFAGQGGKAKANLMEAGILLSEAIEEIDLAQMVLEDAGASELDRADLREATAQILEASQLIGGVHARMA